MIELIGNFSLVVTFLVALIGVIAGFAGWRTGGDGWAKLCRYAVVAAAPAFTVSVVALLIPLIQSDMRFAYVSSHTEHSLPLGYKIASLWAGQEGSLLFWAWVLAVMAAIAAISRRRLDFKGEPVTLGVLSVANAFFAALMLFAANPFLLNAGGVARDGYGLNPMLQHWAMVLHPPTLFLGYAGFTIPFAIMLGALVSGPAREGWAGQMRRWVLASWLFLGAGIALGAWWAYVELGWGGYWAWDPVENASLLPWLTGTALLHTVIAQQQRHGFRVWTASLAALTFILCIFGTYLTRSGVIESVHAFGESVIGTFFLGFIAVSTLASVGVIGWRWSQLRSHKKLESLLSRESMFLLLTVLLLIMTGATLVGTIFPLISGVFMTEPVSVGASYYNRIVAPLALLMGAVMALGPLLVYGKASAGSIKRGVLLPSVVTAVALVVAVALGLRNITAMICLIITAMTILIVINSFVQMLRMKLHTGHHGPLMSVVHLIDSSHRRYGAQLAHTGIVLLFVGVAGSNLFAVDRNLSLQLNEEAQIGSRTIRYEAIDEFRGRNYTAVEARLLLTTASGETVELRPQRRFYDKAENPSAEVAIRSNLREDLYVALLGWEDSGQTVAIQALINPLTIWIWIGSGIILAAGAFCMLPRLLPRSMRAPAHTASGHRTLREPRAGTEPVGAH